MAKGNIEQFDNPINELKPSEQGEEAFVRAGRLTGGFFHQMGQAADQVIKGYQDTLGNQEISKAIPLFQGAYVASVQKLNSAMSDPNTDPNDPTLVPKIAQAFEDNISGMVDHFQSPKGLAFAQSEHARLMSEFTTTARAAQSHMAGVAAVRNLDAATAVNGSLVTQDPSQLQVGLDNVDKAFAHVADASHGVIDTDAVAQLQQHRDGLKEELVIASQKSLMIQGGQAGIDQVKQNLANPSWMRDVLQGPQRDTLAMFATEQERYIKDQARQQTADQHRQDEIAFQAKSAQVYAGMLGNDGHMHANAQTVSQIRSLALMPGADGSAIRAASDAVQTATEQDASGESWNDNYATINGFNARVGATGADALTHAEVDRAFADKQISRPTYERLTQSVEHAASDPAYAHAMTELDRYEEGAKPLFKINDSMGVNPVNDKNVAAYLQWQNYNRQLFDLHIKNDGMTPEQAVQAMSDQSNRLNTTKRIGDFLQRAGQARDVAGLNASFLSSPEPLTLDQVAGHNPAVAGAELNARTPLAPGAKSIPAGLSKEDAAWVAAHRKSGG